MQRIIALLVLILLYIGARFYQNVFKPWFENLEEEKGNESWMVGLISNLVFLVQMVCMYVLLLAIGVLFKGQLIDDSDYYRDMIDEPVINYRYQ